LSTRSFESLARDDFNKARSRALFSQVLALLRNEKDELLSLQEVKSLLRPRSETYRGMRTVPIDRIVGSEGRYQDFNKRFLPRRTNLRGRWERVDVAHHAQITLPPIKLYEIGGIYFVRDGNHRVSVARTQGVEFIDAEVVSLSIGVQLHPQMGRDELLARVVELEKTEFLRATKLDRWRPQARIDFTSPGRYEELVRHVHGHKYFINQNSLVEIPFKEGLLSWFDTVYEPIVTVIRQERILAGFPGRTEADLYVWIVQHWDELKRNYGGRTTIREAATDFSRRFGRPGFLRRVAEGAVRSLRRAVRRALQKARLRAVRRARSRLRARGPRRRARRTRPGR